MRGSRPRVYLAGPITGLDYENAEGGWRTDVTERLVHFGIVGVSPLRGVPKGASVDFNTGPHTGGHESTVRDRWDIQTCDAVLMNLLDAKRVSIGSMIEAAWADAYQKPLVVVREHGGFHDHPMLLELAGWTMETLDDAIERVHMLFWRNA